MTLFYNEELRLLLKICILLLKASRKTISADELNSICETHFNANNVAGRLCLLDENLGLKSPLAVGTFSLKKKEFTKVELKYSLSHYEEMVNEITHNSLAQEMRWDNKEDKPGIWVPYYKENEAKKELLENKFCFIGKDIDDKKILGIGDKSIALLNEHGEKEFHWFILPKYVVLNKNYKNVYGDGFDVAKAILRLHGNWNKNFHLNYILWSDKGEIGE